MEKMLWRRFAREARRLPANNWKPVWERDCRFAENICRAALGT